MSLYDISDKTGIDEFGINHNNFSLRDEIEYNFRRAKEKEQNRYKQLAENYADALSADNSINPINKNEYYLRDDRNYAWNVPNKYDHRTNSIAAQLHNFNEINKEFPVQKPIITGSKTGDFAINRVLSKISPYIPIGINAFNWGYQGAGYYNNWQRAKEVGKYREYPDVQRNENFLKNK